MYVDQTSLDPEEWLAVGTFEWRGKGGATRALRVRDARGVPPRPLLTFTGVSSREAASALTNGELWADAATLPDPGPGVVYTFQLIGLRVINADGRDLGTIEDVVTMGPQTLYQVRGDRERMIPAVPPLLQRVDLGAGVVHVDLPNGFDDL